MVVGVCTLTVAIPESEFNDARRSTVRKIIARTRAAFNVCMAQVDDGSDRDRAQIAFAAVGNDHRVVNSVIDRAVSFVQDLYLAEIEDYSVEMIHM